MKRRTYNNVCKAIKMIVNKGYTEEESKELALKCFDNVENSGMSIEFYIDKIIPKEEYKREYLN